MTALKKEHFIDLFVSSMALFVIEFTEVEEITGDSVKEALQNRTWLQMALLFGAGAVEAANWAHLAATLIQ